jgi:pimeloyl-ACP methyl ester carboxylesterase
VTPSGRLNAARAFSAALGLAGAAALGLAGAAALAAEAPVGGTPCRLPGVENGALCGVLTRPLDPAAPQGRSIEVHFAVLPALSRNKKADPVFFFAGGPGQSALALAGPVSQLLGRLQNRRDIVLIDQRGTGRSAPLQCADAVPTRPLAEQFDPQRQIDEVGACLRSLQALPHGDLRFYTTTLAMQDAEAVRQRLGAQRINLVGASYGTRAALEYTRQFPQAVRRIALDGVAPPDMVLPMAAAVDGQAAFDSLLAACDAEAACLARHPALRQQWQRLLAGLPAEATVAHPVTGRDERVSVGADMVQALVRQALYSPVLASALPVAIGDAAAGRFGPLVGLASALGGGRRSAALAQGMHFSVVCAEDLPRMDGAAVPPSGVGAELSTLYRRICADWPRGEVPAGFYELPRAPGAVLVLSGGIDPVTPPRHGERVAKALGPLARHVVVPNAGHGVLALPCQRDVLFRFIDAVSDGQALIVDAECAAAIPRPPAFVPVAAAP